MPVSTTPRDSALLRPSAAGSTLADLSVGQRGRVRRLEGSFAVRRRLAEMGFTPGTPVAIERVAPLGDPIEVSVRGYRVSLRRDQAAIILLGGADPSRAPAPPASGSEPATALAGRDLVVALAGNPNCGKTTLFNAITGLRQKVANYPGVTVDTQEGRAPLPGGRQARIIDLPGIYSLTPASPDERVAAEMLAGLRRGLPVPDVILAVVDATNLARNLLLTTQLLDSGLPVVVALTMVDEARQRGGAPDAAALARLLGVPVVPVVAGTGEGLLALRAALLQARAVAAPPWRAGEDALAADIQRIGLGDGQPLATGRARLIAALASGEGDSTGILGLHAVEPLTNALARLRGLAAGEDPVLADRFARYAWIDAALPQVLPIEGGRRLGRDRIDGVLLHRVWGPVAFALVMWGLFMAIFIAAAPIMEWATSAVEALGGWIGGLMGPGLLHDLWMEGAVAGVGGVVVFIPQIAFLFVLLSLLEETGYLARGAFLLDRVLSAVGLHGRSFVPLLSSHACAIPGIMASRTIPDPRERLATMLVAPFMACSARLPVYGLLIGAFFAHLAPWAQGTILFALYLGGIVTAAAVSWLLRRTALRGRSASFLIELPPYRLPSFGAVWRTVARAVWAFTARAGTIILCLSVVLWAAMTFPRLDDGAQARIAETHGASLERVEAAAEGDEAAAAAAHAIQQAGLEHSLAGRFGHVIEPVIRPLGYDWQMGIGLIGSFAAREVFVSTMGVVYGVGAVDDDTRSLEERMAAAKRPDGTPVWSPLLAVSLMVWFVLAMQCLSTVAVMVRETRSWRWPLIQLAGMNTLAYLAALAVWQIGSRF